MMFEMSNAPFHPSMPVTTGAQPNPFVFRDFTIVPNGTTFPVAHQQQQQQQHQAPLGVPPPNAPLLTLPVSTVTDYSLTRNESVTPTPPQGMAAGPALSLTRVSAATGPFVVAGGHHAMHGGPNAGPSFMQPGPSAGAAPFAVLLADGQLVFPSAAAAASMMQPQSIPSAPLASAASTPLPPMPVGGAVMLAGLQPPPQGAVVGGDAGPKQLIVNFLDSAATNADLHEAFSQMGTVTAARVIYDKATGNSKCFGFVYFKNSADAAQAIQRLNGQMLLARRIKVSYAVPQRPEAEMV